MATKGFPYKIVPLKESLMEEIKEKFVGYKSGLVKVEGSDYLMPSLYVKYAHIYYNYRFLPDDVVIMTHPKCGTTWMQEIIWTMRSGCQFDTKLELKIRSPFLEFDSLDNPKLKPLEESMEGYKSRNPGKDPIKEGFYLDLADTTPSPRTIKTHLPFSLLNPTLLDTSKVVYVARNPKDCAVSYYHHHRLVKCKDYVGDFPQFLDYFCRDLTSPGPFWHHVSEGWEKRNHPNVLLIFYEDLKEDPMRELKRLDTFLNTHLTDEQLRQVVEHTRISNMKARSTCNFTQAAIKTGRFNEGEEEFIRKGITGGWTNYFTPDLENKFQRWVESWKHVSDLIPFKYKITTTTREMNH